MERKEDDFMFDLRIRNAFHIGCRRSYVGLSRWLVLGCLVCLAAACRADAPVATDAQRVEGTVQIVGSDAPSSDAEEIADAAAESSEQATPSASDDEQSAVTESVAAEPVVTEAAPGVEAETESVTDSVTDSESAGNVEPTPPSALTPALVVLIPTPTPSPVPSQPAPQTVLLIPTNTPVAQPQAIALNGVNVRGGPGTNYPVVGGLAAGDRAEIIGKNPESDWWQIVLPGGVEGWVYGPLVDAQGGVAGIAVAADIPTPPPPTATPPDAPPVPVAAATETPLPDAPAPVVPPTDGPEFRVIEKRLWDVVENGGRLDGPSVICGEKRQLVVNVVDANGSRINGVAVQAQYGVKEIFVTGSQGKGDGVVEYVLGRGQDVRVIRDVDGREVTSEMATGLSTEPAAIPYEYLIAGQFCSDDESCRSFVAAPGCWGHYSWTVTFQRNY